MTTPGYHNRYLRVDVSRGDAVITPLEEHRLRQFVGGVGLGAYLLLREKAAKLPPLSPAAPLAFVFSPLVGSPLTTSAKFAVVCKSPLTQRFNDSLASSGFALAGKKTGFDAIVVVGKATRPSVLLIAEDRVRLEDAGDLWGMTTGQTQTALRDRYGAEFQQAVIGPAGERGVRFSTISHDGRHAGRGGAGAVLGAKNIKAVLVRGRRRCEWANPPGLTKLAKTLSEKSFGPATAKYRELGTASNLLVFNRLGALPTRNFQQGAFENATDLAPETLTKMRSKTQVSCAACTIGCEHIYGIKEKNGAGDSTKNATGVRLEYESLFALGPMCGVGDADAVLSASQRCDELGMDTISAGGTIAFAMDCAERGWLHEEWLRFGDPQAMERAIELIARREGIGDGMAEGSRAFAGAIGGDAILLAPQVKGLEMPGYEPRALQTMALGLAVSSRGADHNRSGAYEADFTPGVDRRRLSQASAARAIETEDKAALMDSLILCKFLRGVFDDFYSQAAEMLHLVTGWQLNADELRQISRRVLTAKKHFNIQAGWQPTEDDLPARFFRQPLPEDAGAKLDRADFQNAIAAYNQLRGWSKEGWTPPDQLRSFDLDI